MNATKFSRMFVDNERTMFFFDFQAQIALQEIENFINKALYKRLIAMKERFYLVVQADLIVLDSNNQLAIYQQQFLNKKFLLELGVQDSESSEITIIGHFVLSREGDYFFIHDDGFYPYVVNHKSLGEKIQHLLNSPLFDDGILDDKIQRRLLQIDQQIMSRVVSQIIYLGIRNLSH